MQQRGLHKGDTGLKIAVCNKENILEKIAPKTSLSCCGRNVFCLIPLIREEIYVTTIEVIRKKPPNLGGPALSRQSLSVPSAKAEKFLWSFSHSYRPNYPAIFLLDQAHILP